MTDANQNPPSEREWTLKEKAEFYASQDATAGLFSAAVANNGVSFSDVRYFTIDEIETILQRGIHVTNIVPPEQGWPMAAHCSLCHKTVIVLSPYLEKPKDGDYYLMKGICLDEEFHVQHSIWPQHDYPWAEFTQEMTIEEAKRRYPNTPITEEEK